MQKIPRRGDYIWPERVVNCMKELISDGLSSTEIAKILQAQFKIKMTRNMVIGKCHREGIQLGQQRKGSNLVVKAKLKEAQDIKKAQIVAKSDAVPVLMPVNIVRFTESQGGCTAVIGKDKRGEALVCAKPLWTDGKRKSSWCAECRAIYTVPYKKPLPRPHIA